MFEETWARSALEPRDPAIGYAPDGGIVTLYPLDIAAGIPHGLIVGETAARQHAVRNIALALASCYSPWDLTFAFAGLGEHPLGEPLDLPHIVFSDDELLRRPQRLRGFIDYVADELESRASAEPDSAPGVVVFADVSLEFRSGQREVVKALLSLAERGKALGVHLLVSTSTVEDTTTWNRLLPLLGWRVVASRLPSAELQRVLEMGALSFRDEHSAYLRAGNRSPRQFTLAPDPPRPAVHDFVQRTQRRWKTLRRQAASRTLDAGSFDVIVEELPDIVPDTELTQDDRHAATDAGKATAALREILTKQAEDVRQGRSRAHRHLIFPAPYVLEMRTVARLYGKVLAERRLLTRGDLVTMAYARFSLEDDPRSAFDHLKRLYSRSRGSVVLFHDPPGQDPGNSGLRPEMVRRLIRLMDEEHDDALIILSGEPARFHELRRTVPEFAERFRWVTALEPGTPPGTIEDPAVAEILRRLRNAEMHARPPDERRPRHIVYAGTDMLRIARLAVEYGRMLAELGVLSRGDVREATADWLGYIADEPDKTMADLFRESRGGVLLLHMTRKAIAPVGTTTEAIFLEQLRSLVREHGENPVVIVCVDDGQMLGFRRFEPHFADLYRRLSEFPLIVGDTSPEEPAESPPELPELPELVYARELPAVTSRRIPIGIQHRPREPAYVHFDADPHLLVAGPPRSGRANALQLLIDGIRARPAGAATDVYVFDAHGILRSLAEEHGHAAFQVPEVGYTDSVEEFREVVDWFVREPPETEVFLFVIDRDLEDDPLRVFPRHLLTSFDNRVHLVLAKLLTVPDQRLDPMVSALHEAGAPALLLGSQYGQEHRLYEAEPPSGPGLVGRGVLVRGGRRHVVQVADRFG
ncbi:hypothetical protein E1200_29165 [Actinomadura sp. GC306]|uniref:hypothetical protein n=1 Tax=Actinomadura sp. GC306 TaxID=2530367 RepID=UPI0010467F50|nr:hypothetical protein [Actinomadura sp. GC306]TDC61242.1 hypothetical protein E1200_29165 [Actinomadura sp. GC306]